jgi:ABC-2 type transport system ATP-binding protein
MKNSSAVDVQDLSVVRGGSEVLHGLSFVVPRGSVCGLLGPSGCGKTTLMRAIVGVQAGVAGGVHVLGKPAGSPELRRRVGYVTQSPAVYGDLTVRENVDYFADVHGVERAAGSRALLDVALSDRADQLVRTLSGGQRSRVGLATALLSAPELLVLDEPTVGLDPVLRRDLWELFAGLAAAGTTLLVSSHVMDEAVRCDRLLLMRDGRIVADDSPQALVARTGAPDVEGAFLTLATGASS